MPSNFEISVQSPSHDGAIVRMLVESEHWLQAWRQALAVLGDDEPDEVVCVLRSDREMQVEVPETQRTFIIRQLDGDGLPLRAPTPRPGEILSMAHLVGTAPSLPSALAQPADLTRAGPRSDDEWVPKRGPRTQQRTRPDGASLRSDARPPLTRSPGIAPPSVRTARPQPEATRATSRRKSTQPFGAVPTTPRVSARALATSPATTPSPRPQPRPQPQTRNRSHVGDVPSGPESKGKHRRLPASQNNAAPKMDTTELDALPQLFRAITDPDGPKLAGGSVASSIAAALDTAWQFIRCESLQALRATDRGWQVADARGTRQVELFGSALTAEDAFAQLSDGDSAHKIKFLGHARVVTYRHGDHTPIVLPVRSALCAPVLLPAGQWGSLLLLNAEDATGFDNSQVAAVRYLAQTLARTIATLDS